MKEVSEELYWLDCDVCGGHGQTVEWDSISEEVFHDTCIDCGGSGGWYVSPSVIPPFNDPEDIIINDALDLAWELYREYPYEPGDAVVRASQWAYDRTKNIVVSSRIGGVAIYSASLPAKATMATPPTLTFPFTLGEFINRVDEISKEKPGA